MEIRTIKVNNQNKTKIMFNGARKERRWEQRRWEEGAEEVGGEGVGGEGVGGEGVEGVQVEGEDVGGYACVSINFIKRGQYL